MLPFVLGKVGWHSRRCEGLYFAASLEPGGILRGSLQCPRSLGTLLPIHKISLLDKFIPKSIPLKQSYFYMMKTKGWSKSGIPKTYKVYFLERHFKNGLVLSQHATWKKLYSGCLTVL